MTKIKFIRARSFCWKSLVEGTVLNSAGPVTLATRTLKLPPPVEPTKAATQDDEDDDDSLSISRWLTVLEHTRDVCRKLDEILDPTGLTESEVKVLRLAARWHDRGKAHLIFKAKLKSDRLEADDVKNKLNGQPAAKAPDSAWLKNGQDVVFATSWQAHLRSSKLFADTIQITTHLHGLMDWINRNSATFHRSWMQLN